MSSDLLLKRISPRPSQDRRHFLKPVADHFFLRCISYRSEFTARLSWVIRHSHIPPTSCPAFKARLCDICTKYLALIAGWWFKMEAELSNWIRGWQHLRKLLHLYVVSGRQNGKVRCLRHWWFSKQHVPSGKEQPFFTRLRQLWIYTKFRTPFAASLRPVCCTVFCSFVHPSNPSWPGSYVFIFIRSLPVSESLPPPPSPKRLYHVYLSHFTFHCQ